MLREPHLRYISVNAAALNQLCGFQLFDNPVVGFDDRTAEDHTQGQRRNQIARQNAQLNPVLHMVGASMAACMALMPWVNGRNG